MVQHTSHYAVLAAVAMTVITAALSAITGQQITAQQIANPGTLGMAAVAVIDVMARLFKDTSISKINAAFAAQSAQAVPTPTGTAPTPQAPQSTAPQTSPPA